MDTERRSYVKRDLKIITSGLVLGLFAAIGLESHRSQCAGKVEWTSLNGNISLCLDQEGNIIAQGPDTPARKLRITKGIKIKFRDIWTVNEDKVSWVESIDSNYVDIVINTEDLKTEELTLLCRGHF